MFESYVFTFLLGIVIAYIWALPYFSNLKMDAI